MPKIDPRGRQGRQVKLALWITPSDSPAVFPRRRGKQQCERFWTGGLPRPEQFMNRTTLKNAARRHFVQRLQAGAKAAAADNR